MAVSLTCTCSSTNLTALGGADYIRSSSLSSSESAVPSLAPNTSSGGQEATGFTPPVAAQNKERFVDDSTSSSGFTRWATMVAAAAASATVMAAAPAVLAADGDVTAVALRSHSVPGDLSLSIAIPIPDIERWANSTIGFVAPPPRSSGSEIGSVVAMTSQGGCPAWQPSQFEMTVPDGVHPKSIPRHGNQWPAHSTGNEAPLQRPVIDPAEEAQVKNASLIEALLRMSDVGLTCFSL